MRTSRPQQKGIAALLIVLVVLFLATLVLFFSARIIVTDNKIFNNVYNKTNAENAAQAGIDFALGFLNSSFLNQEAIISTNAVTTTPASIVTTSLTGCNLVTNTATLSLGTLANGSTYAVTFTCTIVNNTNILTLKSVGTSADGSSVRTVQVTLSRVQSSVIPLISVNNVAMSNNSDVNNSVTGATKVIDSGSTIALRGVSTPTASCSNITVPPSTCAIVTANDASLSSKTAAQMETSYLGNAISTLCSTTYVDYVVNCSGGGNRTYNSSVLSLGSPSSGAACPVTVAPGVTPANPTISSLSRRTVCFNMGSNNLRLQTIAFGSATAPNIILVNQNTGDRTTLGNAAVFYGGLYTNSQVFNTGNSSTIFNGILYASTDYSMNGGTLVNGVVVVGPTSSSVTISANGTAITRDSSNTGFVAAGSLLGYAITPGSWKDF